jgi:hypothetical protein
MGRWLLALALVLATLSDTLVIVPATVRPEQVSEDVEGGGVQIRTPSPSETGADDGAGQPRRELTLRPAETDQSASPSAAATVSTGVATFDYSPQPGTGLLPEDRYLGPLQDLSTPTNAAQVDSIRRFLEQIKSGTFPEAMVVESARDRVLARVAPITEGTVGFTDSRIGALVPSGDEWRADVLLASDTGRTYIEVYVAPEGQEWRVANIQGDTEALAEEWIREEGTFEPQTYGGSVGL